MVPTSFTVRAASVGDAGAIAEVHVAAWRAAYVGQVPQSYLDGLDVQMRTEQWAAVLRGEVDVPGVGKPTDLVVERNDRVVGFVDVGGFRDAPSPQSGELWAMYVHPSEWGTGAGRVLMDATMTLFAEEGRKSAYLWVLTTNTLARGFYEHMGWSANDVAPKQFEVAGAVVEELRYSIRL